jgi:predicted PurR-regulated permease PerM
VTPTRQALFWILGLVAFGLLIRLFSPVLLPFVAGFAVAYFFDPVVDKLGTMRINRTWATSLVLLVFFLLFVLAVFLLAPVLQQQLADFSAKLPRLIEVTQARLTALITRLSADLSPQDLERIKSAAGGFAGDAFKFLGRLLGNLWSGGVAFFNLLSLIFITPIVAFYILRDWPLIVKAVDSWLPRDHAPTIRELVREADEMVSGFVRGMGAVCFILAVFYGLSLTLIGLDFGLVIGIGAGLISFVPFVGAIAGFVAAVGMALFQYSEWVPIAMVAGVFAAGQVLEGNFLTPTLVGGRIRLHPVWIMFALLAGGTIAGFVGILLSVPVAAVIGVLVRFLAKQYVASRIYQGSGGPTVAVDPPASDPPPPAATTPDKPDQNGTPTD